MRPIVPLLALLALAPLAAALAGPFAGVLAEGATNVHRYDNRPPSLPRCVDNVLPSWYAVQVAYAPREATLFVEIPGYASGTLRNGGGGLYFQAGGCSAFDIRVTNVDGGPLDARVAYKIDVTVSGNAAG